MKILIIAGLAGSLIGFRKPLIKSLLKKGMEVHAAAPDLKDENDIGIELTNMGVIIHNIPIERTGINPLEDIKSFILLCKLMHKIKPSAVLGYTIKPVIYGSLAAWITRVPYRFSLITGLGYAFQESTTSNRSLVNKIAHQLYKISLNKCQTVFFQNQDDEKLFREINILSKKTNTVVVNGSGVDLDEYPKTPLPNYEYPRFLFIGRLLVDKGVREYAEAAALIKQKYPMVEFDLVGRIDINPSAIQQAELNSWISDGRLNYFGQLKDVKPRISACSVYVLPSYREGTPRTVLEAMSMGRAIITTDAPGCKETVINNKNGFLVPVKSVEALVVAMKKLIDDPDLIEKMGQRSRAIAEEKYDVHKVNDSMLKAMGISESTNRYA